MHLLQGDRDLSQRAWNNINDSMRTTACILFRPEAIAAASVSLAARTLGVALPDSPPWWTVLDVTEQGFVSFYFMLRAVLLRALRSLFSIYVFIRSPVACVFECSRVHIRASSVLFDSSLIFFRPVQISTKCRA